MVAREAATQEHLAKPKGSLEQAGTGPRAGVRQAGAERGIDDCSPSNEVRGDCRRACGRNSFSCGNGR